MLTATDGKLPQCKGIVGAITTSILSTINISSLFTELDDHMYDSTVDDNHICTYQRNHKLLLQSTAVPSGQGNNIKDIR